MSDMPSDELKIILNIGEYLVLKYNDSMNKSARKNEPQAEQNRRALSIKIFTKSQESTTLVVKSERHFKNLFQCVKI
jgi:hypothetical protein